MKEKTKGSLLAPMPRDLSFAGLKGPVEIRVGDSVCMVRPWHPDIGRLATCKWVERMPADWRKGLKARLESRETVLHNVLPGTSSGIILQGLRFRLERMLRLKGIGVTVIDERKPLPEGFARWSPPEGVEPRPGQAKAMNDIVSGDCGVVCTPPAWGKTFLIEMMAEHCRVHKLKLLVATTRKGLLLDIRDRLLARGGKGSVSLCNGSSDFDSRPLVCACSAFSLHKVDVEWADVIMYDEVHGAAAATICRQMSRMKARRRYGLSATPKGRTDGRGLIVEAMFGPYIVHVTYTEAKAHGLVSGMEVRLVDVPKGPSNDSTDPIIVERHLVTRNGIRNGVIRDRVRMLEQEGREQILICVRTTEHARFLHALLPDYECIHEKASPQVEKRLLKWGLIESGTGSTNSVEARRRFSSGELRKAIATTVWNEGVDFPLLDTVVRADVRSGQVPGIQAGGRGSRKRPDETKTTVVVDFIDSFDKGLEAKSWTRVRHYTDEGWKVARWE